MSAVSREVRIVNRRGLHARASAQFVNLASELQSKIEVEKDSNRVCGTSIMGLMMLAASPGCCIRVTTSGRQAQEAMEAIAELVASRFGEEA